MWRMSPTVRLFSHFRCTWSAMTTEASTASIVSADQISGISPAARRGLDYTISP